MTDLRLYRRDYIRQLIERAPAMTPELREQLSSLLPPPKDGEADNRD